MKDLTKTVPEPGSLSAQNEIKNKNDAGSFFSICSNTLNLSLRHWFPLT